jgi:hypothetical protein
MNGKLLKYVVCHFFVLLSSSVRYADFSTGRAYPRRRDTIASPEFLYRQIQGFLLKFSKFLEGPSLVYYMSILKIF